MLKGLTLSASTPLIGLLANNQFVAERSWATMLLAFLPQPLFLVPSGVIAVICLGTRKWSLALANILVLGVECVVLCGFRWHLGQSPPGNVSLLSLNVDHGAHGIGTIASAVIKERPDIICFQEADLAVEAGLRQLLPHYRICRLGSEIIGTVGTIRNPHGKYLPAGDDRAILSATLMVRGTTLTVMTTHYVPLKYDILASLNPTMIADHLRKLATDQDAETDTILDELRSASGPVVLCGDFNGPPHGRKYGRLTGDLSDAWNQAGHGFGYTAPANSPVTRVDWVLTSRDLSVTEIFPMPGIVSDHLGLIASLRFEHL